MSVAALYQNVRLSCRLSQGRAPGWSGLASRQSLRVNDFDRFRAIVDGSQEDGPGGHRPPFGGEFHELQGNRLADRQGRIRRALRCSLVALFGSHRSVASHPAALKRRRRLNVPQVDPSGAPTNRYKTLAGRDDDARPLSEGVASPMARSPRPRGWPRTPFAQTGLRGTGMTAGPRMFSNGAASSWFLASP